MSRNPAPNQLILTHLKAHYDLWDRLGEIDHITWPNDNSQKASGFWIRASIRPTDTKRNGIGAGAPEEQEGLIVFEIFGPSATDDNKQMSLADSLNTHFRDTNISSPGVPPLRMREGHSTPVRTESGRGATIKKYTSKTNLIINYVFQNWI